MLGTSFFSSLKLSNCFSIALVVIPYFEVLVTLFWSSWHAPPKFSELVHEAPEKHLRSFRNVYLKFSLGAFHYTKKDFIFEVLLNLLRTLLLSLRNSSLKFWTIETFLWSSRSCFWNSSLNFLKCSSEVRGTFPWSSRKVCLMFCVLFLKIPGTLAWSSLKSLLEFLKVQSLKSLEIFPGDLERPVNIFVDLKILVQILKVLSGLRKRTKSTSSQNSFLELSGISQEILKPLPEVLGTRFWSSLKRSNWFSLAFGTILYFEVRVPLS